MSLILDAETVRMLDALVKSRGNQKGGGKAGAIREAIKMVYNVSIKREMDCKNGEEKLEGKNV